MSYRHSIPALVTSAIISGAAFAEERTLVDFAAANDLRWQTVNDGVMGGLSRGGYQLTEVGTLLFRGVTSLDNNGGFSSIRTRRQPLELAGFEGLTVRLKGDGRTYKVSLRTEGSMRWIAYWADVKTVQGEWIEVRIPFTQWVPTSFGRRLPGPALDVSRIDSVGFMLYDKQAGPFSLEVDRIAAYRGTAEPTPELKPESQTSTRSEPSPRQRARRLIEVAIERGVPLFNSGEESACQAVYEVTVSGLVGLGPELFSAQLVTRLRAALTRPSSPQSAAEHAWTLRRALDAAYAELGGR